MAVRAGDPEESAAVEPAPAGGGVAGGPGRAARDPAALGALIRQRLQRAASDSGDLLRRFAGAAGEVPLTALLFDRRVRAAAVAAAAACGAAAPGSSAAFALLLEAARAAAGVEVTGAARAAVRLGAAVAVAEGTDCAEARGQAAPPAAAAGAEGPAGASAARNVKGELQAHVCKVLSRPVGKGELVYATEQVADRPPMYESTVQVWGRSYTGERRPQKKAAEHEAALAALDELLAAPAGEGSPWKPWSIVDERAEPTIDHKGLLLGHLQARGLPGGTGLRFEHTRAEAEEKVFQCKVEVGGRTFLGAPQLRGNHASTAKAKRAAEQDAARAALEALAATEEIGGYSSSGSIRRVQALLIPASPEALPSLLDLAVHGDDFLGAAASALHAGELVPHPLQWSGDRPKGLCLYERVAAGSGAEAATAPANPRASELAWAPVAGDALLLCASARSAGAALEDISAARYEVVKADRRGALRCPAASLNASRGTLLAGRPELPPTYDPEAWVGQCPKTLLNEVLKRRKVAEAPHFLPAGADSGEGTRASAVVGDGRGGTRCFAGRPRRTRAEAQQDAALAALHALASERGEEGIGLLPPGPEELAASSPLSSETLGALEDCFFGVAGSSASTSRPDPGCLEGTRIVLQYRVAVESLSAPASQPALVLEECAGLRLTVGARVVQEPMERLALAAPLGEPLELCAACLHEGQHRRLRLELRVLERLPPSAEGPDSSDEHECPGQFSPPLGQQRLDAIVHMLCLRGARSAVDLGCGGGRLLEALLAAGLEHVVGVERSERRARAARRRAEAACGEGQVCEVVVADLLVPDERWMHVDAVVCSEVLEHLTEADLSRLGRAVLGPMPEVAIVTTPNGEFRFSGQGSTDGPRGSLRHSDHEREWTRAQFLEWAGRSASGHGYMLESPTGVGYLPGHEDQGPCTQIGIFSRTSACRPMFAELHGGGAAGSLQSRQAQVGAKQDLALIVASALRVEELASRGSLRKHVHREGEGDCPAYHSRIRVHYATVLLDGTCVDSSRDKNRITPVAFQLAGGKAHEAWHRSVATMRRGEVAWVESPPEYAFGPLGAPPLIPAGQALWFKLELVDFRPPGTVRGCTELAPALEEAERHLGTGREDIKRSAFAQARQAFRRARVAIPDKMLVGQPAVDVARFARVERSSLLNQALCSQKLAEGAEELAERQGHWADVVRVCSTLLRRHSQGAEAAEAEHRQEAGGDLAAVAAAIRAASADSVNDWAAKAYFRRGLAREGLGYLTDAVGDLEAARGLQPEDAAVGRRLHAARQRQHKAELRPSRMFAGILERERAEREREEAARALEQRRQRRDERLRRQAGSAAVAPQCG